MKRQIKILLAICIVALVCITSYMYFNQKQNADKGYLSQNEKVRAEVSNTINSFFTELKNGRLDNASKYVINDNKYANLNFNISNETYKDMLKKLFSKLSYRIENVSVKGTSATARVNITCIDLLNFYNTYFKELNPLMQSYINGNQGQKTDAEDKIKELIINKVGRDIDNGNYQKFTGDIDIKLKKVNGKWFIEPDQQLIYYLTGKMTSIMNK